MNAKISSWNALASFATDMTSRSRRQRIIVAAVTPSASVGVRNRPSRANRGETTWSRPMASR